MPSLTWFSLSAVLHAVKTNFKYSVWVKKLLNRRGKREIEETVRGPALRMLLFLLLVFVRLTHSHMLTTNFFDFFSLLLLSEHVCFAYIKP